ncbi:unnamed protein product [Sphagnum troendelagicum]|uniref:Uncharacterized protein n=1 Tax=Sphagnum troendelagicum TaxID=128251 RepID=A0ABP0UR60_9BRYO
MDEGSSSKLEHNIKESFRSAFNWPMDEGNSFKLMKVFLPNFHIVPNQVLVIVNNKINYLATFQSCIF